MAITMAGMGSRFTKAGYDRPKYEIPVLGHPLFDWSMLGLRSFAEAGWTFCFATRRETEATEFITTRCAALEIEVAQILELDGLTNGQATTALLLAEDAPADCPFAVFNIDTYVAPGAMTPAQMLAWDGWVPCFPAAGDGWSFARLDDTGTVVELREKVRISDHATVGFYGFDSVARYRDAYARYYAQTGNVEKGEYYIAPLYNQLIADGARVGISTLSMAEVGMLGTPEQVTDFGTAPPASAKGAFAQ